MTHQTPRSLTEMLESELAGFLGITLEELRDQLLSQPTILGAARRQAARQGMTVQRVLDLSNDMICSGAQAAELCLAASRLDELAGSSEPTEQELAHLTSCVICRGLTKAPPIGPTEAARIADEIRSRYDDLLREEQALLEAEAARVSLADHLFVRLAGHSGAAVEEQAITRVFEADLAEEFAAPLLEA